MLRDNAWKFYRDQADDISKKPIDIGQYMNINGLLAAILKFAKFWMETTCFISETLSDRAKRSLFSSPVGYLLQNYNF